VNPLQFAPNEDFSTYPRTFDEDLQKLSEYNVDMIFAPNAQTLYPDGKDRSSYVTVPVLSEVLEGESRPGFFKGVATVVCKLLNLLQPDWAFFGEKDYQQLLIIRKMVADLCLPITVVAVETVRESDGLAMSSRNQYLDQAQRHTSAFLYQTLQNMRQALLAGGDPATLQQRHWQALCEQGFEPDYLTLRRADNLLPVDSVEDFSSQGASLLVILVAARLGRTRLIDNLIFDPGG